MANNTKARDSADVLNRNNSQDKSVPNQEALRSIFDHSLECVLPDLALKQYVKLKQKHVELGLKILEKLPKIVDAASFLKLCRLVDRFQEINYPKKRTITSNVVEDFLKTHDLLTPVETSSETSPKFV